VATRSKTRSSTLRSLKRVERIINDWRGDVRRSGLDAASVYDPTRWMTADLVRDVTDRPLEPSDDLPPREAGQA
jgi:hypothetical protein